MFQSLDFFRFLFGINGLINASFSDRDLKFRPNCKQMSILKMKQLLKL